MSDVSWMTTLPPRDRKKAGFVDRYLYSWMSPRLPDDDFYMRGWNEAQALDIRSMYNPLTCPRFFSEHLSDKPLQKD